MYCYIELASLSLLVSLFFLKRNYFDGLLFSNIMFRFFLRVLSFFVLCRGMWQQADWHTPQLHYIYTITIKSAASVQGGDLIKKADWWTTSKRERDCCEIQDCETKLMSCCFYGKRGKHFLYFRTKEFRNSYGAINYNLTTAKAESAAAVGGGEPEKQAGKDVRNVPSHSKESWENRGS